MKNLLYKEFKLSVHPLCYVFIGLSALFFLIPNYPLGVGSIYLLTIYPFLFVGVNKGQQSNDLLYTCLLPIRKKDAVKARVITVIILQLAYLLSASVMFPVSYLFNYLINLGIEEPSKVSSPGLGLNSFVLLLAFVVIGLGIADLIYFSIYYKNGKSIVKSTLLTVICFAIYITLFTVVLPLIPGLEILNNLHIGIQFGCLFASLLISFGLHYLTYKVASKKLEKVDF